MLAAEVLDKIGYVAPDAFLSRAAPVESTQNDPAAVGAATAQVAPSEGNPAAA